MNTYTAYYKDKKMTVEAETSYKAQTEAARAFGAKKQWDVTVVLNEDVVAWGIAR